MAEHSFGYGSYLSPFTWRYGSPEMRTLWSEVHRRLLWRRIWCALAEAQAEAGLLTCHELADIKAHAEDIDIPRALEIEGQIRHDLMAEVRTFAEQCQVGGGKIHLGATSMDIVDNADTLRMKEALTLVGQRLRELLAALAEKMECYAATPCLGYTHLQPAEPTTLGYRLAQYAQDLLLDLEGVEWAVSSLRAKGIKGAVGTSASYQRLLADTGMTPRALEAKVMEALDLTPAPIATQTYPRKYDLTVLNVLASLAQSLHKMFFDLRVLQSPGFGELAEPFGRRQVGSSAMPFKRNPISSEKICSLARFVAALPAVAWGNAASSLLERTLDDSANRRTILPEAFLATDEMLIHATRIVRGLVVNREAMERNLARFGPFAATEALLMDLVKAGADRQAMHEAIREASLRAWEAVQIEEANPLVDYLAEDARLTRWLPAEKIREVMVGGGHLGDAEERTRDFIAKLQARLEE